MSGDSPVSNVSHGRIDSPMGRLALTFQVPRCKKMYRFACHSGALSNHNDTMKLVCKTALLKQVPYAASSRRHVPARQSLVDGIRHGVLH